MAYQVSVFVENKPGHLQRITSVLGQNRLSIKAMTLTSSTMGWGVFNLVVNEPEKALSVLSEANIAATLRPIVVLEMDDVAGGLDIMLQKLSKTGINIQNAYARNGGSTEKAQLVIDIENIPDAELKLRQAGLVPLDDTQIYC